jgi:hypothetical protein
MFGKREQNKEIDWMVATGGRVGRDHSCFVICKYDSWKIGYCILAIGKSEEEGTEVGGKTNLM